MGTHPIFESDFDCLTETMKSDQACIDRLQSRLNTHATYRPQKESKTQDAQRVAQGDTAKFFKRLVENKGCAKLDRARTIAYCRKGLTSLSQGYSSLDASRPWLIYWTLHALDLLDVEIPEADKLDICEFLELCQSETGGFGGGPGQLAHLATSYAAMNAIAILGCGYFQRAYQVVNRSKMLNFLKSVKNDDGSFCMHVNGERDTRAVYCAASIATMLKFDDRELFKNSEKYLQSCQSWDGGFGPGPGSESHGGYTYTSVAALTLINKTNEIRNLKTLVRWLANRQMPVEGGFNGRANKLVDSCYNFWQGGSFPLIQGLLPKESRPKDSWICDSHALQEYTLLVAQSGKKIGDFIGGFTDRPPNGRDFYHTCYALSGMSVMQHIYGSDGSMTQIVLGHEDNEIAMTNPLHNVRPAAVLEIYEYFEHLKSFEKN